MSDKPEPMIVRMLRWIDSGIARLMERVGRTEQQVSVAQLSMKQAMASLERIEARLDRIERHLMTPAAAEASVGLSETNRAVGALPPGITGEV